MYLGGMEVTFELWTAGLDGSWDVLSSLQSPLPTLTGGLGVQTREETEWLGEVGPCWMLLGDYRKHKYQRNILHFPQTWWTKIRPLHKGKDKKNKLNPAASSVCESFIFKAKHFIPTLTDTCKDQLTSGGGGLCSDAVTRLGGGRAPR